MTNSNLPLSLRAAERAIYREAKKENKTLDPHLKGFLTCLRAFCGKRFWTNFPIYESVTDKKILEYIDLFIGYGNSEKQLAELQAVMDFIDAVNAIQKKHGKDPILSILNFAVSTRLQTGNQPLEQLHKQLQEGGNDGNQ